jgi:uncharacterized protein YegL
MSRRLPVYLLLDVSGSMAGEPIEAVRTGLATLMTALRQEPTALETAYLSVITFGTEAAQVVPLTEVADFRMPELKASGTTALGAALKLLAESVSREVRRGSPTERGDWKPVVFLLTDGEPTDDWAAGKRALADTPLAVLVACAAGPRASVAVLQDLTEAVVRLDTTDAAAIRAYFQWVSSSIRTSSQKVDLMKHDVGSLGDLPPPPPVINVAGV